jgi:Flp pilus assembly protein TadG
VRKRTKHLHGEEGQALVELALVIPLLLFIIFAIIDFGLAINQYNNTTNLANLGARASVVYSSPGNANPGSCTYGGKTYTTLVGYIDCEGANEGGLSNVSVTVCNNDPAGTTTLTTGDSVSVHVASTFNWFGVLQGGVGNIGGVVGPTSTVASSATMRMEGSGTVASTSGTWFGSDANPIPGQSSGSINAPTISSGSC